MATIPHLKQDFKEFIELLNSTGVKYVIIGAYATAFHGAPRYTGDIDFLVEPSPANAASVMKVLVQFGLGTLGLKAADLTVPDQVVQLGTPPTRIDILTSISAVEFEEAYRTKVDAKLDGVPVSYIARDLLIRNKKATGRPKDAGDADILERRSNSAHKKGRS